MNELTPPAEGRVTIYSTSWCVWCDRAKNVFDGIGVPYLDVNIELVDSPRERLETISGRRSVPQIFIGRTHVGGFDDLVALETDGVLPALFESEGITVTT